MPPFVHFVVNLQRLQSLESLRDYNLCTAFVQIVDDPIAVETFVREHGPKRDAADKGRYTDCVISVCGHQNEPDQVAQGIHESKDLGGPLIPDYKKTARWSWTTISVSDQSGR